MLVELALVFASFLLGFVLLITLIMPRMRAVQQAEELFASIDRGISSPPYRLAEPEYPPGQGRNIVQLQNTLFQHARNIARDAGRLSDVRLDFASAPLHVCVRLWETRFDSVTNRSRTRVVTRGGGLAQAQDDLGPGRCTNAPAVCNDWAVAASGQNSEVSFSLTYDSPIFPTRLGLPECVSASNPSLIAGPTQEVLLPPVAPLVPGVPSEPAGFTPGTQRDTCGSGRSPLAELLAWICKIFTLGLGNCRLGC